MTVSGLRARPAMAALRLHWRSSPRLCIAFWVATIVAPVLGLVSMLVSGALVGAVARAVTHGTHSSAAARLRVLFAVLAGLMVARAMLTYAQSMATAALRLRVSQAVEERVMAAAASPPGIAHLEDPEFADELRRARGAGAVSPDQTVLYVAAPASRLVIALGSCAILGAFHWWLPPLLLLTAAVQRRWIQRDMALMAASVDGAVQSLRRSTYTHRLATDAAAAKEVRVFGLSQWLLGRLTAEWTQGMAEPWRRRRELHASALFATLLAITSTAVAVGLAAAAAVRGEIGLGALAVYLQTIPGIAVLGVGNDSGTFFPMAARAARTLLGLPAMAAPPRVSRGAGPCATMPRRCIRFESVGFAYPGAEQPVFDGLDLEIEAGRSTAIVGDNGAGKTTLVKLLTRLYEPTAGRISVDGTALDGVDTEAWRQRVSVVFQDFVHWPLPARDNVQLGALDADAAALCTAAEHAGLAKVIARLPRGWDTMLSREFPGGVDLSGGQWQRIAIARALLKAQRGGVLVLDEPTANLDVRAEAELFDRLLDATRGLTTVLISHRFSSVRRADRIVVLRHGRVVESGSHDDLVAERGVYAGMFGVQARPFLVPAGG